MTENDGLDLDSSTFSTGSKVQIIRQMLLKTHYARCRRDFLYCIVLFRRKEARVVKIEVADHANAFAKIIEFSIGV